LFAPSSLDRGVQHHPHHRITHTQPVMGGQFEIGGCSVR
jgi:hypothetical protein